MRRKKAWIICTVVVLLISLMLYASLRSPPEDDPVQEAAEDGATEEAVYFSRPSGQLTTDTGTTDDAVLEAADDEVLGTADDAVLEVAREQEPYVCPVDFEALWEINTDVYAWLDIPGTEISYPILQSDEDDDYYLQHNLKQESDSNGVIYTEGSYNGKDFDDPVTVIYGHNMSSGAMFGTLQSIYSSQEAMEAYSDVIIYLPDRELHFTVFAAVPYDNRHILYNYDFTNKRTFRLFFQEILSIRSMQAVFAEDATISSDERAIILSTCLTGNRSNRFLVCGKLSEVIPTDEDE